MITSLRLRRRALLLVIVCFLVTAAGSRRHVAAAGGDGQIQQAALRHDTFDSFYRAPFGAVAAGTSVHLRFRTAQADVQGVTLFYYQFDPATGANTPNSPVSVPMTAAAPRAENGTTYDIWECNLPTPSVPAILYYKFRITDGGATAYYSDAYADDNDNLNQGGDGAASSAEPFPAFQLTVYDPNFQTPTWLQNANVYQIFPDRFRNGDKTNDYCVAGSTVPCPVFYGNQTVVPHTVWNEQIGDPRPPGPFNGTYGTQFYGGDLKGIEQKLDYLQSLGIDTIYLNPIFAARSNHRYDTDDYLQVDAALGGDAAWQSLATAVNQRGMHLILDAVFNHASSDSLYFDRYHRYGTDGACENTSAPYRSWFIFNTNNVPCGSNDYPGWFGFDTLPQFVDESAQVRDFFYRNPTNNVTKHWYDRGASGWRFDVAPDISHNWWHEYRPYAKAYKSDGPLVGEIFADASQFLAGDQLDAVMNYRFRKNVLGFARGAFNWGDNDNNGSNQIVALKPSQFDRALRSVREDYPAPATAAMLNLLDSHDTNRALYVLTEQGDSGLTQAKERLKQAALFQFTYIGAPMIYYGDEAGLNAPSLANGGSGPEDDPYNRAPYPWADESGNTSVYGPADNSLIAYYSQLAALRKAHTSLRTGSFETLLTGDTTQPFTSDDHSYAFARVSADEKAVVVLNNGSEFESPTLTLGSILANGKRLRDAFTGALYTVSNGTIFMQPIAPRGGTILFALPSYSITGRLTDRNSQPASGVSVELSGAQNGTSVTDANGNYGFFNLNAGVNYTVTPSLSSGFNFSPVSVAINNLNADQIANFIVLPPTISGRVTTAGGAGIAGVTIIVRSDNTAAQATRTDANGNYSIPYTPDRGVQVTPVLSGFTFNPTSIFFFSSRGGISGNQTANFTGTSTPINANVQLSSASYSVGEDGARATITVTRTGNINGGTVVSYATDDNTAAVRCDDTTTLPGVAFARCDYATSVDTLFFSGGETSKTFNVPVIDDAHVEPNETVTLRLTNPNGAALGLSTATLTITDNDAAGAANPIFTTPFFVRQQYLDFLSREPEAGEPWSGVLNRCPDVNNLDPTSPSAGCDRILVSSSFFGSPEFQLKGFYVFLFYKVALGRLPQYTEIIPDMRTVTGATADEVFAKRATYAVSFTERADFHAAFDGRSDAQYVAVLLDRYGLASITTPDPANPEAGGQVTLTRNDLASRLAAGTLTRAQVLRAIVQSAEVANLEFNNTFVAMQYYGYLRRTPDAGGYQSWLNYLATHPGDFRTMVNGFMNSTEYRLRFGAGQ